MWKGVGALAAFAAVPLLRLAANNPGADLPAARFAFYWGGVVLVLALPVLWLGRSHRELAERIASSLAITVLAGGYLAVALSDALGLPVIAGLHGSLWLCAAIILSGILASRWRPTRDFLLAASLLLLLYPAAQVMLTAGRSLPAISNMDEIVPGRPNFTPDIYWFVLDGYGRDDVLIEFGAPAQEEFLVQLTERGFEIDQHAVSSYPMSFLSMASTLSMAYVADESTDVGSEGDFYPTVQGDNIVVRTLRSWGYEYGLSSAPFWQGSQCRGYEDVCLLHVPLDPADWALLSMTVAAPLLERVYWQPEVQADRVSPLTVAESVDVHGMTSPRFVFAHLINPHPPYYRLGPDCAVQDIAPDPIGNWGSTAEYLNAVECLNEQMLATLDLIVGSDPSAIVLIQGDHGPAPHRLGAYLDGSPPALWTESDVRTRLGVLNAMRLPEGCSVPQRSALVNTFRVVLSCLNDENLDLLETRAWVGTYGYSSLTEVVPPS